MARPNNSIKSHRNRNRTDKVSCRYTNKSDNLMLAFLDKHNCLLLIGRIKYFLHWLNPTEWIKYLWNIKHTNIFSLTNIITCPKLYLIALLHYKLSIRVTVKNYLFSFSHSFLIYPFHPFHLYSSNLHLSFIF